MDPNQAHTTERTPREEVPLTMRIDDTVRNDVDGDDDTVYEDTTHDASDGVDHEAPRRIEPRMEIEDPSIEPTRPTTAGTTASSSAMPHRGATNASASPKLPARGKVSSAAARIYGQPIPQTAFLQHLKQRERDLNAIIREKYYHAHSRSDDSDEDGGGATQHANADTTRAPPVASPPRRPGATVPTAKESSGTPMAQSERLERVLASFPTSAVRDPFCPKPPVHASTIRLEASVAAVKRMFPQVADSGGPTSRIASARGSTHSAHNALPRPHTAEAAALPILVTSPSFVVPAVSETPVQQGSSPSSGARTAPMVAVEVASADGNESGKRQARSAGRPTLRNNRPSTTETVSRNALDTLVQFLPEGYREPEILLKDKPLAHPNDPVTGAPRPYRRYRLGLQHDPANNVDPAEAIEALQDRKLPTALSISSTDPAVLALVDSFIESSPGLEQVDLGAMDDRYEMVLRNVYAALSRNVSVGVVTGVFPKEATRAFKSTISANTERREKRLAQLAGKERELKIADMERRILKERQDRKKLQFEQMRQRTRFCDRHARSNRDLLRAEGNAWQCLCELECASLQDVREKERLRFEWWTASVQTLEELMGVMRANDSREEHQVREQMRLEEVNQRLAAQVELRKYQKQLDNDRHIIFAEQFERRKRLRMDEKKLRRQIEAVLLDHLRVFLDERAREEKRRREEEAKRHQDESYKAYRLRQLQQNQEVLESNELERRKTYEQEAWKAYDLFKRKHFEGIVVAKNQQRVREVREKRQAAFSAADSAIPSLHFRMAPQTISNANASSAVPTSSNTLTYLVNTIGDYHVLHAGAVLGVQFDTDLSALTTKQKVAKAEPQGGIISCKIVRPNTRDIDEGREGIVLFVSTAGQLDPNVQITGHVEREPGKSLASPSVMQKERLLDNTAVAGGVPTASGSHQAGKPTATRRQRAPSFATPQQSHLSPYRGGQEESGDPATEDTFAQLCGDDRIFGVLRVRDETDEPSMMSKRSSSARSRTSTSPLVPKRSDGPPRLIAAEGVRESDMLDPYLEEIATESDSDNSISSSSSGMTLAPKKGYGSVMVSEATGPQRRPRRRIVSWNGRDVGVVELGYAGAPIDNNRMTPYYLNSAIHKVRSKKSAITMQIRKRRGTLDVAENSSPTDVGPTVVGPHPSSFSVDAEDEGVEVFRMRLFHHCPRHAVSDILAQLSYFNSAGAVNMAHPTMESLASNEVIKVATNVSIAFRRSCLPPAHLHAAQHNVPQSQTSVNASCSPTSPPVHVRGGGGGGFLWTPESSAFRRGSDVSEMHSISSSAFHDVSLLVWSTRTTNTFVKMQLPLFFGQPQREPIYFLEDQTPLPLCRPNTFGWCFPVQANAASYDLAASGLSAESPLRPNSFGSSVFGRGSSMSGNAFASLAASTTVNEAPASLNYLTNANKHVVVRDHSDGTLDAIEVLVGKHAAHGLHLYLSITGHSRGDVFVMLESNGFVLGDERCEPYVPGEADVGSNHLYGRRLVERLSDCAKKQVGVEVMRTVRELLYHGELVAVVEGLVLSPKEFEEYGDCFTGCGEEHEISASDLSMTLPSLLLEANTVATALSIQGPSSGSGGPTPSGGSGRSLTHLRTIKSFSSARQGPVSIHLMANRFVTLLCLRDLIGSVAYSNLNKDPSPVKRHVDVCLSDKHRRSCSLVRSEITVVPVDDITEINLATPPWGFRVWRAPTDTKPELQQYLPAEAPFFVAPDATAVDPDSLYFDGGWLEVEIVDGLKDGDVLYLLQDDRTFIENPHTWSVETVRQASRLYTERLHSGHELPLPRDSSLEAHSPGFPVASHGVTGSQSHGVGFGLVPAALEEPLGGAASFQEGHMMSAASLPSPHRSYTHRTTQLQTEPPMGPTDADPLLLPPRPSQPQPPPVDETPFPRITMSKFSDDDNEPHSEFVVTSGLALDEIPPLVSRREMSRGRNSGSFSVQATPQANALVSPDNAPLRPPPLMMPGFQGRPSLMPDGAGASGAEILERTSGGQGLHYTSPMLRVEFKTLSLAALQYLLRHIAFKSVAAAEKSPKYFGTRTIEVRAIVGDPHVRKFRKFDPFVPIVHQTKVKVCEPLLKTVSTSINYKEGQGTMGIPVGLCEPGTDGYRCFNRGFFAASIVKGVTADDRILIRSVDPSQFDYGLSFLDLDPLAVFQPRRSTSLHNLKRASSMRMPSVTQQPEKPSVYTPGAGGVGPDGEINANCPPPPSHLAQQWAKAITTGKYKFQQWKCCEVYNNERAMVGSLTATYSELFVGLRESDKVRKFGKAVAASTTVTAAQPSPSAPVQPIPPMGHGNAKKIVVGETAPPLPSAGLQATAPVVPSTSPATSASPKKKKGGPARDKSNWAHGVLADKESKAIPISLPEGATPIRYTDILSLTKLIAYENRSANPTDLKKVVLLSLSDEHTTSHLVMELTVQPVDDATEIRKAFPGPLLYRHGFPGSYISLFDHCTLFDPDTEEFNGGHLNVAMAQVPADGDAMRFMSLDEQRRHREVVLKDPLAKYRGKPTNQRVGPVDGSTTPNKSIAIEPVVRRGGRTPLRGAKAANVTASEASKGPLPAKPAEPEVEKDPNEPYEFVVDHRRNVIYWLDRSYKSSSQQLQTTIVPTPSHGGRFIQSGAFARESPRHADGVANKSQGRLLGDEGVLRRIASFLVNVDSRKKQAAAPINEGATPDDSNAFSVAGAPPEISITDGSKPDGLGTTLMAASTAPTDSSISLIAPEPLRPPNVLNLQVKLDKLINEEDIEEGEDPERPAPVTLNMLQALMRTIVFANVGPTNKVKSGSRLFSAKIAAAGGGEEGRAKVVVQTTGSLLGWPDNVAPSAVFRPRLGTIQPLQRMLFLNDIIVKSGFLLIEISEGFEPNEDVLKINDIGRQIVAKNGKLFLQPKEQLIGVLSPVELEGVTQGYLIAFDSNCRVSGSILQNMCRSVSYGNTSRRTGRRKLRVTMCDGCLYETSVTEVTISVEQDEHTIPVRFGSSGGSAVWMEGMPPVHVFPDIQLTLKGPNVGRVLEVPSVLEIETQAGGLLSFGSSDEFEVDADGRLMHQNEEVAKVFQCDPDCIQPRQPVAMGGQRRSFARSSFAQGSRREGSIVSLLGGTSGSGGTPSPANTPSLKSPRKSLSPRHSVGHTFQRPPHFLRIEFTALRMECLEQVVRCIQFTCAQNNDSRRDSGSTEGGGSDTTAPIVNSTGGNVTFASSKNASARRSVVKIDSHDEKKDQNPTATGTGHLSSSGSGLPSNFSVMMQLTGIANDVGKISSIPALHIQGAMRVCDAAALFSVSQGPCVQGPAGDIFNNVVAKFAPQWIRVTWRAALEDAASDENFEESGKRDARNRLSIAAASALHLGVSGRLGLVISASGEEISSGRDKIATVVTGDLYARSKSLFATSSRKSMSQTSSKKKSITEDEPRMDDFLCAARVGTTDDENDGNFSDDAEDVNEGSNSAFPRGPHSFNVPRTGTVSQQLIFQINASRKVNADTITRLLRSVVCIPPIAHDTQFSICFEASEECVTTRTVTVGPYAAGRRSSRASLSMSTMRGAGLSKHNSQRKSSIHSIAPTIVLVEQLGRKSGVKQ